MVFLRTNADKWRERKIDECDRIREEEKKDRLAVVKEKRKKEENLRMTIRIAEPQGAQSRWEVGVGQKVSQELSGVTEWWWSQG